MAAEEVVTGVYAVSLGIVNAFVLRTEDELILIDTGVPDSEEKILEAIQSIGHGKEAACCAGRRHFPSILPNSVCSVLTE